METSTIPRPGFSLGSEDGDLRLILTSFLRKWEIICFHRYFLAFGWLEQGGTLPQLSRLLKIAASDKCGMNCGRN